MVRKAAKLRWFRTAARRLHSADAADNAAHDRIRGAATSSGEADMSRDQSCFARREYLYTCTSHTIPMGADSIIGALRIWLALQQLHLRTVLRLSTVPHDGNVLLPSSGPDYRGWSSLRSCIWSKAVYRAVHIVFCRKTQVEKRCRNGRRVPGHGGARSSAIWLGRRALLCDASAPTNA